MKMQVIRAEKMDRTRRRFVVVMWDAETERRRLSPYPNPTDEVEILQD